MKLYFAHNFNNRQEFRKLELELEKELGIELLNPFYDVPERKAEMLELDNNMAKATDRIQGFKNRFNRDKESAELIVSRDIQNLASCDGLFTIVEKPSFGTAIEICNAVLMRKPIFFISKVYVNHPFIKVYVDNRFETVDEFKDYWKRNK